MGTTNLGDVIIDGWKQGYFKELLKQKKFEKNIAGRTRHGKAVSPEEHTHTHTHTHE